MKMYNSYRTYDFSIMSMIEAIRNGEANIIRLER